MDEREHMSHSVRREESNEALRRRSGEPEYVNRIDDREYVPSNKPRSSLDRAVSPTISVHRPVPAYVERGWSRLTQNDLIQAGLEVIAFLACIGGLVYIYKIKGNWIGLFFDSLWFLFGLGSNGLGMASLAYKMYETDPQQPYKSIVLHLHFLFAWFETVIGYSALVGRFWLVYYPTPWAYIHTAISFVPVGFWAFNKLTLVADLTKGLVSFCIFSHIYICFLAKNWFGLLGAIVMIFSLICFILPTKHRLFNLLTSREGFVFSVATASILFTFAAGQMSRDSEVKSLKPF